MIPTIVFFLSFVLCKFANIHKSRERNVTFSKYTSPIFKNLSTRGWVACQRGKTRELVWDLFQVLIHIKDGRSGF